MIELFVEKNKVDIDKIFSTLLTYAIDDVRDFGSKNSSFSKTIILPGTKRNNLIFGNIFNANSRQNYVSTEINIGSNFNAAISARAIIFAGNIQIFKGVFRLLEIIIDDENIEYECAVTGELGGFVTKVGNKKLEDLDFSAYNHTYSIANITGSWANYGVGSGYFYPVIDYGNYSSNKKDWKVGTLRPSFFVKEYITKIFEGAGYALDSTYISSTRFKKWVVPHNQKDLRANNTTLLDKASNTNSVDDATNYLIEFNATGGTLGAFSTGDNMSFDYTNVTSITADLTFNINLDYTGFPSDTIILNIRKEGVSIFSNTYSAAGLYTHTVTGVVFALNDTLDFRFTSLTIGQTFTYTASASLISFSSLPTLVLIGDTVKAADAIPKGVLQTDFLSSVLKLSNLYVFEDIDTPNSLSIEPFVDFYANASSEDWSNKLDRSKPIRLKPMSELNSRIFEFNYAKDSDYYNDLYSKRYNQNYGSYAYDSGFEFAKDVQKVDLIFAGSPLVGYVGEDKVYTTIFKKTTAGEEQIDSTIRILQANKITGVASWGIKNPDATATLWSGAEYGYAGHFDDPDAPSNDINFGVPKELFFQLSTGVLNVTQFNVFWSSYLAEITDKDSKLLTAHFRLDYKDIYSLQFNKLIWIDGNLYRLNKIVDFNVNDPESTKVELLKIINKIY